MLETERLILKPLTYKQLLKYVDADGSLEKELKLNNTAKEISPELKEALEETILPNVADSSKNYLYNTLWSLILKVENKMVGDICIFGEPNEKGEIEIGYGTYIEFENNGYMTEAVGGMIEWAKKEPNVHSIVASTEKENVGSYKILEKNKFIKIGEINTLFGWKLSLK